MPWRRYFCEFNRYANYGRMPNLFNDEFFDVVPPRVIICDQYGNKFEVKVLKDSGQVIFLDGWRSIGKYYNLKHGGWIKLYYSGQKQFVMDVYNRWMEEVEYPQPPKKFKLGLPSDPIVIPDDNNDHEIGTLASKDDDVDFPKMHPNLRWFYLEVDRKTEYGKMPGMFCKEFSLYIQRRVLLIDPVNNQFEVKVSIKGKKVILTDGWSQIGSFYSLYGGGWIKMYFQNRSQFAIQVFHRNMDDVPYPHPPTVFKLTKNQIDDNEPEIGDDFLENVVDMNDVDNIGEPSNRPQGYADNEDQYFVLEKTLSDYQANCSALPLTAAFCSAAFPSRPQTLDLEDQNGRIWPCNLRWADRTMNECYLTCGWRPFAKEMELKKGSKIRLAVLKNNESIMKVTIT